MTYKQELQTQILNGTKVFFQLTEAIGKLPECGTRTELMDKWDIVAVRLATLQDILGQIDKDACYFGFVDKCSGIPCGECEYVPE